MQSHAKTRGNTEDDAETDTKEQGHHGGIVIGAEIAGDDDSCPDSDGDKDCRYYRADYTGDDNVMGPAGHIFGKSGRHFTEEVK